ncbi:MAG: hypothetical protein J0M03_17785 [Acidobacteria bacterium]|nr:hypothetical protein [Acidobacteriota bacterium]
MQQADKLSDILKKVIQVNPYPLNYWETTAIVESLGYTDKLVQQDLGFENCLALGQELYNQLSNQPIPITKTLQVSWQKVIKNEIFCFLEQFSYSFVYAIPWLVMFILENSKFGKFEFILPPDLAAPLSLALMASLITSGGFIQIIVRRGQLYLNLGEIALARKICLQFLFLAISITIILAFIGLVLGFYRNLFPDKYLIMAAIYYLILSLLWLLCAIISLRKPVWHIPSIFIIASIIFILLSYLGFNVLFVQFASIGFSLIVAIGLVIFKLPSNKTNEKMEMPRAPVLIYSLAPYFCYGLCYFSFLFADRLTAGSTVSVAAGLSFALNLDYKKGMDIALLIFLILVAVTEYLHYKFMHFWYDQAKNFVITTRDNLSGLLIKYYLLLLFAIFVMYLIMGSLVIYCLNADITENIMKVSIIGIVGYAIFTVGLLNSMILFSLSRPILLLRSIIPGLLANFVLGYLLSHFFATHYAAIGFLLGASIFSLHSTKAILAILRYPDYAYYAS